MTSRRSRSLAWWHRQRPFVVLVALVGLVVTLPNAREDDGTAAVDTGAATAGAGPGTASAGTPGAAAGAAGTSGSNVATGGTSASTRTGGGSGAGPAAVAAGAYPGVGTAAALAHPRCDAARGTMKLPTTFAAECVAAWPKGADNGGATAQGVTKDTIRIALLDPAERTSGPSLAELRRQAVETLGVFEKVYELWGRKLDVRFVTPSGTDEASQRADAIRVANEIKPFLASSYLRIGTPTPRVWATELAARGVISFDELLFADEARAQPGFRWGYAPDDRLNALSLGEYVGKRLARRPARWAGDQALRTQTRSFGLAHDQDWDRDTFDATMRRFGASAADVVSFDSTADPATLQQQASTQIARFKAKGVNNVIVVGGAVYSAALTRAATQQNFFPEWTISGWNVQDVAVLARIGPDQRQWAHAFGIGLVPPLEQPIEISQRSTLYRWAYGRAPIDEAVNGQTHLLGKSIMSGFHLAGPTLTPASFRDALFRMKPKAGRWCGCVSQGGMSFGRHIRDYPGEKYFDVDDFAEKWWSADEQGEDEVGLTSKGVYRVVHGGRRYSPGDWPSTEPEVFDRSKSIVGFTTLPPSDDPPDYPPPPR